MTNEFTVLHIPTDITVPITIKTLDPAVPIYQAMGTLIDAEYVERVRILVTDETGLTMAVDDSGLYTSKPDNYRAGLLYPGPTPIKGDALLAREMLTGDGIDWVPLGEHADQYLAAMAAVMAATLKGTR